MSKITAEVITRPGNLGDVSYAALQIAVEGFESPYALTLMMPTVGYKALAEQSDPAKVLEAIAESINSKCEYNT